MKPQLRIKREKSGAAAVSVEGDLTVRFAKDLAEIFRKLSGEKSITLTVNNANALDLCFLQLLVSFRKHCLREAIPLTILLDPAQADRQLLDHTGFSSLCTQ